MKTKTKLKKFIQAIIDYSKGKSPKGLRVYKIDKDGIKREILDDLQEFY